MLFDAAPPAIIQQAPLVEVRFGLSIAVGRFAYDRFALPRDFRGATLAELIPYLPEELRHMPHWALEGMLLVPAFIASLLKTTVFLTSTSAADQTYSPVLTDWNSGFNKVEIVSHGADGAAGDGSTGGSGGGGGGYAKKANVTLTPGGTATYRLRAGNSGSGTGNACWFNGASLAASSVGIQGAGGTTGALTASAIGDVKTAGGGGGAGSTDPWGGGGGGAAGPNGGGNAGTAPQPSISTGVGGSGDNGSGGAGSGLGGGDGGNGTEWDASHGSGGGGAGGVGSGSGGGGGFYGAGGGGGGGADPGGTGKQALIVITNNG